MQLQNTAAKERSSTVLRLASFLCSILKRSGGAVAVGTPVAQRPPHGSVRALVSAYGSYRGCFAAKRNGFSAHGSTQLMRLPSFASGTRPSAPCSPWSVVFPPCPPPACTYHLCSGTSQVLHSRPTPYQRSCRDYGSSPSSTGPLTTSCRALVGSPGSRAWRFHAYRGSLTSQVQWKLAISRPPVLPSP